MKPMKLLTLALCSAALLLMGLAPALAKKTTLKVAFAQKFDTLTPYQQSGRQNIQIGYLLWDALVLRDADSGKILPHVAKTWKYIDENTLEFTMESGIKFHNGAPLTAEAIRFNIEDRLLDPAQKAVQAGNFKWIKQVDVVNDTTFRVVTHKPYAIPLERLNTLFIMDPKSTKEMGDQWVHDHVVGSGPYKFVEWAKGSRLVMTKNENYWKAGSGKIKDITIKIVPEASTRVAELLSGGVDLSINLTADQVTDLDNRPEITVYRFPIIRIDFWNFDAKGRASETALKDVRVRRAIAHAVDRDLILNKLMAGGGYKVTSAVNPHQFGFDDSLKGLEYNPEKAKKLLAEAGYANGLEIDLWQYSDNQNLPNQAAMQMLSKIGIKVNLKDYRGTSAQMTKLRRAGKITGIGNFNWGSYNIFDADAILYAWFSSETNNNYAGDMELAGWLQEARDSVDDSKRIRLYKMAQERVVNDVYWLPFYGHVRIYAHNKDLNFKAGLDEVPRLEQAEWVR